MILLLNESLGIRIVILIDLLAGGALRHVKHCLLSAMSALEKIDSRLL
jgi:hypothetical protein